MGLLSVDTMLPEMSIKLIDCALAMCSCIILTLNLEPLGNLHTCILLLLFKLGFRKQLEVKGAKY